MVDFTHYVLWLNWMFENEGRHYVLVKQLRLRRDIR